jgi:hypothetical protein
MWLLDSKLHETFPWINIDGYWCETHERSSIIITKTYIWKGAITSKLVQLTCHHSYVVIQLMIITGHCSLRAKLIVQPVANTWGVTGTATLCFLCGHHITTNALVWNQWRGKPIFYAEGKTETSNFWCVLAWLLGVVWNQIFGVCWRDCSARCSAETGIYSVF